MCDCAVIGISHHVSCGQIQEVLICEVEIGAIVSQNMSHNCLMEDTPVFGFSNCNHSKNSTSLDMIANDKTKYYHNNGSGCFHYNGSTVNSEQYPDIVFMHITRVTVNISFYSSSKTPGICNNIACDFHVWEASCILNEAIMQGRQLVCHNTGISISVGISDQAVMVTLNNIVYTTNKELTHYSNCTGKYHKNITPNCTMAAKNVILACMHACMQIQEEQL